MNIQQKITDKYPISCIGDILVGDSICFLKPRHGVIEARVVEKYYDEKRKKNKFILNISRSLNRKIDLSVSESLLIAGNVRRKPWSDEKKRSVIRKRLKKENIKAVLDIWNHMYKVPLPNCSISYEKIPVCPMPLAWSNIYLLLCSISKKNMINDNPPNPLILGGWIAADCSKRMHWRGLLKWALRHDLFNVIPLFPQKDIYLSSPRQYNTLPDYYFWRSDRHETRKIPPSDKVNDNFKNISDNWFKIVGENIGSKCRPFKFTGRKKRRLLCLANFELNPPWGTWTSLDDSDDRKKTFTHLRKSINNSLIDQEIDHIDFLNINPVKTLAE